jgi:hypothetical protein
VCVIHDIAVSGARQPKIMIFSADFVELARRARPIAAGCEGQCDPQSRLKPVLFLQFSARQIGVFCRRNDEDANSEHPVGILLATPSLADAVSQNPINGDVFVTLWATP